MNDAYAAGLFDGEGTISTQTIQNKSGPSVTCLLSVTNTNREVLEWLKGVYGGAIHTRTRSNPNQRTAYIWNVYGENAEKFARAILSYSIIKKEQLELFLMLRETITPRSLRFSKIVPEVIERRFSLIEQMRELRRV